MKNQLSRRHLLLSAALMSASAPLASISGAEEIASPRISRLTPMQSRIVRLRPDAEEIDRVVVTAIATEPAGNLIAAAGDDHVIRLLDVRSMSVVKVLRAHRDLVRTLAFNSDGSKLISAGNDGQLLIWNRLRNFSVESAITDAPAIACACFSPSGQEIAAVGFDDEVLMVREGGSPQSKLQCGCCDLRCVTYRDNGELMVVAGRNGEVDLVNPRNQTARDHHLIHGGRIRDARFIPGTGVLVSAGEDGRFVVFDTETKKILLTKQVTSGRLFAVALLGDQHAAVAGSDNVIRIVEIKSGNVIHQLEGHDGSIASLAASGKWLFSGGYDATLRRWTIDELTRATPRIATGDEPIDR